MTNVNSQRPLRN